MIRKLSHSGLTEIDNQQAFNSIYPSSINHRIARKHCRGVYNPALFVLFDPVNAF